LIRFRPTVSGRIGGGVVTIRGKHLLAVPVRLHGIQLGRPVDLLLDREGLRVLGLDVLCGDEVHRFLPLPTAAVSPEAVSISSPLVLLEEDQLDFYRTRAFAFTSLRGRPVEQRGREVGSLDDIVVRADGSIQQLVVTGDGDTLLPFDDTVRVAAGSRSAA
jgi:sporulation protein YlmC with PRC-barrel domain